MSSYAKHKAGDFEMTTYSDASFVTIRYEGEDICRIRLSELKHLEQAIVWARQYLRGTVPESYRHEI